MRKHAIAYLFLSLLLLSVGGPTTSGGDRGQIGVVWKGTFSFVDERDFSLSSKITVPKGTYQGHWYSSDGSFVHILINDKHQSVIASIDVKQQSVANVTTLPSPAVLRLLISAEGDVIICCGKFKKQGPSLLRVSGDKAQIITRRPLTEIPRFMVPAPKQFSLILGFGQDEKLARVEWLDIGSLMTQGSLDSPGRVLRIISDPAGHDYYVLSEADGNEVGTKSGVLLVVEAGSLEIVSKTGVTLEGRSLWDESSHRFYVFGREGKGAEETSVLNVFHKGQVQKSLRISGVPVGIALVEGGEDALVLMQSSVTIVEQDSLKVKTEVPLNDPPTAVLASFRTSTAFVRHADSEHVTAFDRESGGVLGRFKVGRGSVKFWTGFSQVLSYATLNPTALAYELLPTPVWAEGRFEFFSPSADRAYFNDSETNDVTIVNTKDNNVIGKLTGGWSAVLSSDGKYLFSFGIGGFRIYDTASLRRLLKFLVPPGTRLYRSADESYGYLQTVRPHVWPIELGPVPKVMTKRRYKGNLVLLRGRSKDAPTP